MKHRFFTILSCPLLLLASGCSSETNEPDEPVTPVEENSNTLTIRIAQSDFTRADENETGHGIKELRVIFLKGKDFFAIKEADNETGSSVYTVDVPNSTLNNHPDGIMVFANYKDPGLDEYSEFRNCSVEEFADQTRTNYVMSSVIYFNGSDEKIITPIDWNNLVDKGDAVNINLERICSKVTLKKDENFSSSTVKANKEAAGVTLTVNSWGVTGTDKSSYLFKYINPTNLPEGTWWQDTSAPYMNHWAYSTQYSTTSFPDDDSKVSNEINVKYLKFSEITSDFGKDLYVHESTRPKRVFNTLNALPSIVIKGIYRKSNAEATSQPVTLYRDASDNFFTEVELWKMIATEPDKMVKEDGSKPSEEELMAVLEISHADNHPARIMEVKLKSGADLSNYKEHDPESINQYLANKYGKLEMYLDGKCYFIVPIQHNNFKANLETQEEGAYGLVRNHHYTITLKSLRGIGYGVASNDAYAIMSSYDTEKPKYNIQSTMTINDWSKIDGQEIE